MHIELEETGRITFMTDRQKRVLDAMERFWSRSSNKYCVRHVIANLQSRFKGQLSGMYVWNVANSSCKNAFIEEMTKLEKVNERAYDWIIHIQLKN
ncbi:hypothetical protein Ddye_025967 [Dipteronia dyeriana]|uniref:MULE transposase domain-containing protein n=1 Tax=Dipteronia dyeriana TaxID=168575 RepID=A0AAD9TLU6_9ROSI|nr:hypothetical protein Ddye_025967 [Dipteronia dyeriana]